MQLYVVAINRTTSGKIRNEQVYPINMELYKGLHRSFYIQGISGRWSSLDTSHFWELIRKGERYVL